ncbi:uncharacterized protein LOC121369357 [Gigantopelta aegis]|uniref:uncharacterized protein LOC121369357 n=1 Tax=Gigantopelta aegis TaxID=1735272 RepID=UPI001B88DD75|nr:uncharacterized protein LOC121369357 [Gigantopelta aegis]XP_041350322.1 uncharacterized protein LOC121369357 [Gigantopelta aegis]
MSGSRAPSCTLCFQDQHDGDILVHEVHVPTLGAAKFTYYCCLQWNGGQDGGGYCGIQDHPDGKCYIFSLWDPQTCKEPIVPVFKGPGTVTQTFDGEGTGLKSMNFDLGWETDKWYTIVVRRWDVDGKSTYFGFWVEDQDAQKWTHLVTMRFPVPDIRFRPSTACFIEDWHGNGKNIRRVLLRNGFKRYLDQTWSQFSAAKFSVTQEDACKHFNENYDAGCEDNSFYMQTGCLTIPKSDLKECPHLSRISSAHPERPEMKFEITKATREKVEWEVLPSSPPQFRYTVMGPNAVDSETRACDLCSPGSEVTVTLEDIFGRHVSRTAQIS